MVTVYRITDVSDERIKSYKHLNRLTDITNYIKENYEGDISLESLAKIFGYSPTYLSRMFQKYAGVNFKAYLQDIRLRYAWKEVKDSDKTLSEIAMENGFPNSKALARSFQKKYGMLPSEYRKREK